MILLPDYLKWFLYDFDNVLTVYNAPISPLCYSIRFCCHQFDRYIHFTNEIIAKTTFHFTMNSKT